MRRWCLVVLALVGCGDGTGGDPGRVAGFVADPLTASFHGDVTGNLVVAISQDGTTWVDLGSATPVTVPLQTSDVRAPVNGEVSAPPGQYSRVRLTLSGAQARLNGGSSIGTTFLAGNLDIPLGGTDDEVVIVVQVPQFDVKASGTVRHSITFTLHSAAWITEAAVQALTVDDAAIQAAVTAVITVDPRD